MGTKTEKARVCACGFIRNLSGTVSVGGMGGGSWRWSCTVSASTKQRPITKAQKAQKAHMQACTQAHTKACIKARTKARTKAQQAEKHKSLSKGSTRAQEHESTESTEKRKRDSTESTGSTESTARRTEKARCPDGALLVCVLLTAIGWRYKVDWEPEASSRRRVLGVFWRCPAVLRGPSTPNRTQIS